MSTKKILIVLSIILIVIITVYIIFTRIYNNGEEQDVDTNNGTNISSVMFANSLNLEKVPTRPPEKGGGLDTDSPVMQESATHIAKIVAALPYERTLTTSNGITIDILIPGAEYQDNIWTLSANIYGIDYEVPKEYPEYEQMKIAFREGASHIFTFIQDQDANPEKIIFKWGDRLFIDNRAIEWLQ